MSDGIAGRSQPIIGNVQALRAIAALMVATMHAFAVQAYQQPGNGMLHLLHTAAQIGHAGVDIFFVISGFIITTVARRVAQDAKPGLNPSLAGIFALHRAARIYPLYWIVLFVGTVTAGSTADLLTRPWNLVFITAQPHVLLVAWTLKFEIYFYAVATMALLVWPQRFVWVIALWAVAQIVPVAIGGLGRLSVPQIYEFPLGCAVAVALDSGRGRRYGIALAAGAVGLGAAFVAFFIWGGQFPFLATWRGALYGVPCALLLYALVGLERDHGLRLPAWLQRRGAESYSLYLWHLPIFIGARNLGLRLEGDGAILVALGLIVVALVAAYWSYRLIERPFIVWAHAGPLNNHQTSKNPSIL
jgi:exopolysaccharide production protein ExoZ